MKIWNQIRDIRRDLRKKDKDKTEVEISKLHGNNGVFKNQRKNIGKQNTVG